MVFSIVTRLYIDHHYLIPEHFITPVRDPVHMDGYSPSLPLLSPWLYFLSLDLSILDISYKRYHTICGLLYRVLSLSMFSRLIHSVALSTFSFIQNLLSLMFLIYTKCYNPLQLPFYGRIIFHCVHTLHFVCLCIFSYWKLGRFHVWLSLTMWLY